MQGNRFSGGLWCQEVLAVLSDYLDGELAPKLRSQVDAHLGDCDVCERFGGEFATVVGTIRATLAQAPAVEADVERRLRDRLFE